MPTATATHDDTYHVGNFFMDYMSQNQGDHIWQIDAGTGKSENKFSVKSRSIRLARSLRNAGMKPGDVLVVSGKNHLDLHIPFYAAFMNGYPLAGVDPLYKYEELKLLFNTTKPTTAFCEVESYDLYCQAARDLGLDTRVITFGEGDHSMAKFLKVHDDYTPEEEFKVATFDTNKVFAWLISTSGTTGLPKVAAFRHQDIMKILRVYTMLKEKEIYPALNLTSVQWISSYLASLSMITANHIKIQTSSPVTLDHAIDIINKYKPVVSTGSPNLIAGMLKYPKPCDLTCFNKIIVTGSSINAAVLKELRSRMRKGAVAWNLFAQTECLGPIFHPAPDGPSGNVGVDFPAVKTQLVDLQSGEIITEPHKIGELWSKGPRFAEYYNNPEASAQAFTADGWYKTGDLLYRDENGYYFFVERMSSAFKCRRTYVMPLEVEQVIRTHPDVVDVCVMGVPDPEDGRRAMACVIRRPGSQLMEQDVKDIVADKLSINKHLHGGVVFVNDFPRTVSGKIARAKLRDLVLNQKMSDLPCTGTVKRLISTFQQLSVQ